MDALMVNVIRLLSTTYIMTQSQHQLNAVTPHIIHLVKSTLDLPNI